MFKKITYLTLLILGYSSSWSTHLVGGYCSYSYLTTNSDGSIKYRLDLNLFRDCKPGSAEFDKSIEIGIYKDVGQKDLVQTIPINNPSIKKVNPPGNTPCPFLLQNICVEQGYFSTIINLDAANHGYHIVYQVCCRNTQVNLAENSGAAQGQTYYAFIPPSTIQNSSPRFSGIPVPYMCQNEPTDFLLRAIDPDGDSLVYSISRPYQGASPLNPNPSPPKNMETLKGVNYLNGFSETQPFGNNGSFSVHPQTGLTKLTAQNQGNYTVGIQVKEFRNGKDLGNSTRLDLQVWVIGCPQNQTPIINLPNKKYFEVVVGEEICIDFESTDPDNDFVTFAAQGNLFDGLNGFSGSKAVFKNNLGQGKASGELCWRPLCNQVNDTPYYFTVNALDNGCPPKREAHTYAIKVLPFRGADSLFGPAALCNSLKGVYSINRKEKNGGYIFWQVSNGQIYTQWDDSIEVVWDLDKSKGKINAVEISKDGCAGDTIYLDVELFPSPKKPSIIGKDTLCLQDSPFIFQGNGIQSKLIYDWFVSGADSWKQLSEDSIEINKTIAGNILLKLISLNEKNCPSDTQYKTINIRKPNAQIWGPKKVCPNNSGYLYYALDGERNSNFLWITNGGSPDPNLISPDTISIAWADSGIGTLKLLVTDKFGCKSDTSTLKIRKDYQLDKPTIYGDTSVCLKEIEEYRTISSPNTWFIWKTSGLPLPAIDSSSKVQIQWSNIGLNYVSVIEQAYDSKNAKYCISPESNLPVNVYQIPTDPIILGKDSVCQLDTILFQSTGSPNNAFIWYLDKDTSNIEGQQSAKIKLIFDKAGKYELALQKVSLLGCKSKIIDTTIVVLPKPQTFFVKELPPAICFPDSSSKLVIASGFENSDFTWGIKNGTIQSNKEDTLEAYFKNRGDLSVWVVETSEFGCPGDTILNKSYFQDLQLGINFVSVMLPDDQIEIKWQSKNPLEPLLDEQKIYRSSNGGIFSEIATTAPSTFYTTDKKLNTDENLFSYYVSTTNLCNEIVVSDTHTHVQGNIQKLSDIKSGEIDFSSYKGWKKGVNQYEIYRRLPNENFLPFDVLTQNSKMVYSLGLSHYQQCFRIKSKANLPRVDTSWSNEFCLNFEPVVFIPNAFTPDESGELNQSFGAFVGAVKTFQIQIFNRWGEQIFSSTDKNFKWDGTYQKKSLPIGVYAYHASYTDFLGNSYQRGGSIHLLR